MGDLSESTAVTGETCWFRRSPSPIRANGFALRPVFDPLSGETHFLSDLPDLVLDVIDTHPRPLDEIITRLTDGEPLDDEGIAGNVAKALAYLEQAELVESSDCSA
jgi:PqqD family protein of HPr-rel-A system